MSKLVEEWRPIVDYEGLYEVSDWARVKRVSRLMIDSKNRKTLLKEKILHQYSNNEGYKIVILFKNNCQKHFLVHRLVAEAFIPNPENKHDVGHLKTLPNGLEDRTANEAWNIAWMTQGENANYGSRNERISKAKKGVKKGKMSEEHKEKLSRNSCKSKCVGQYTLDGRKINTYHSLNTAAKKTGCSATCISMCCRGKYKHSKGFIWRYENRAD